VALALYRKYRSATFAEVIGQEHVTGPLSQALSAGRINHAFLFSGPRGCGKTSSARILARSLNCEQGPTPTPCGVCHSCKDLAPNGPGSIDVIEIDAASHGGVDDARDLRERAYYAPARDRYKVYIIDEAHMVTTQGFNALLKLVEEPPDFLIFIFATTEPDKVLQTIRSRTHHYPFRLIPPSALRAHLERICEAENSVVEPTVFPLVVRSGGGSARDSLSILDQLLAGAGPDGVTYSMAVGLLGVTDSALLDDMIESLAVGDSAAVYRTIDRVVEAGHDPRRFAADLLERFRDLMVLDAVPDAVARGLIDYPADQAERMAEQSRRIGTASLVRFADIAHTTLTDMRGTTSPRLMLELLCARMMLPDASSDSAALLQRIERLERRQSLGLSTDDPARQPSRSAEPRASEPVGRPSAQAEPMTANAAGRKAPTAPTALNAPDGPVARSAEPVVPAAEPVVPSAEPDGVSPPPVAAEPVPTDRKPTPEPVTPSAVAEPASSAQSAPADASDSARLRRIWPEVMDALHKRTKVMWAMMNEVGIASVDGEAVHLLAPAGLAKRIADDSNLSVLLEVLKSVVSGNWQLTVSAAASGAGPNAPDFGAPAAGSPTVSGNDGPAQAEQARPAPDPRERANRAREAMRSAEAATRPAQAAEQDDGVDEDSDLISGSGAGRVDPEVAAMELLKNSLGARPMDG
jgi:DNA polymerase-3 subunit gamma/tau